MNKNIHRIIFNAARGVRMAVAETASAQGKTSTVSASVVAFSLLLSAPLNAQVIADKAAPKNQQPTVLQSASGTTQVNIQTPSSAGVSRNTYSQFDVNKGGVILNNSRTDTPTQLGGYVQGNPWLATGGARVILNEVNSSNPSQLKGFVEVAGQRAEVIIANPAGISLNGAGFINASGVTLTTGSPVVNAGSLESFRVRGGTVAVDGAGLDTSTADYTHILARAVQVNAGIWAKDLKVVTGANDISASSAANPAVTATVTGTTPAPAYALDVSALGGMYAQKIYLIGTEAGVGVRNSGVIGATAGDVTLSNSGWLSNSGTLSASGNSTLKAEGSIANTGKVFANASTTVTAPTVTNEGGVISGAQLTINANNLSNIGGRLQQSGTGDMALVLPGTLNNTAGTIASNAQNLTVSTATLTNTGGSVLHAGTGTLAINTPSLQGAGGTLVSSGALNLQGDAVDLQAATTSAQQININAGSVHNAKGQIVGAGNVGIAATVLDNTQGLVQSDATLTVNARQINNAATFTAPSSTATALGLVGKDVQLVADSLNNQGGEVLAGKTLTVQTRQSIDNGVVSTGSAGSASAQTGLLYAGTSNTIQTAGIAGNGQVLTQGDLRLDVRGDFNNTGVINANGNANISSSGTLNNSGTLSSGKALVVAALNLDNTATGVLSGTTGTNVTVADTLTNRGLIDSGNSAGTSLTRIQAQTVSNIGTGRIYGDNVAIAANTLTNDAETLAGVTKAAVIASRNRLDLGVTTLSNNNGATILSLGDMAIGGSLDANNRASGAAGTVTNSASQIQSVNGSVTINTASLQNLNPTFSYEVVAGATSAEKTEYILTTGQTIQDTEVAMYIGGRLMNPSQTNGRHVTGNPGGRLLLSSDPVATVDNLHAYRAPVVYTPASQSCTGSGDSQSCTPIEASIQIPADSGLWAAVGMSPATTTLPSSSRPPQIISCAPGDSGACTLVDDATAAAWDAAAAPYITLQRKLDTVRDDINAALKPVSAYNQYSTTTQNAIVNGGAPATISSAGNITINASNSAINDNSRILAGGTLAVLVPGGALANTTTNVTVQSLKSGTNYIWSHFDSGCGNIFGCDYSYEAYYPNALRQSTPTTVQVSSSYAPVSATPAKPGTQAAAATGGGGLSGSIAANLAGAQALNNAAAQSANNANRIASTTGSFKLPTSSLYQINSSPSATYLVQTDPRFTNRNNWLSSDYISTQNALDPNVTQKRLGDGFYEQQLIREQVAALTGQRFLGNFQNDEQQYMALMNSGLTFASKFNLRQGIALSAEQMAMLTADIVWLEQQTITLADGSTTQALVPRVYAALKDGDLAPSGALLSGNTVSITTAGDLTNSGTIAGRKTLNISANNINNLLGQINGGNTTLTAKQVINNIGGAISADNNLKLEAGRDINVKSTTQQSSGNAGGYQFSQSGIDRMAGLYTRGPGTLLASAGNNINLTAAQVVSGGNVQIEAGNDLTLATLQQTRSDNFNAADPNNHFLSNSSKEVGSNITSAGNTKLTAGNTLQATAAKVEAGGDLTVNANNIVLLAGQSKASSDSVMTNTSGDMISSTTTVTKESQSSAKAQVNQLTGKNVTVTAEQDLVSVGSKFAATGTTDGVASGSLTVEGKNSQTFYAAKDVNQSSKSVESSSSMLGGIINLGSSTTTDTSSKQVSIASTLESSNAINVRVGNSATLEGAELTAKNIAFINTDPNKAGVVNLNGSLDTTQTAHTEKSEILGVYQSASGQGSTTQTLNQTKLNGNVTFDKSLTVNVQTAQTLKSQITTQLDTLSQQSGLAYLKDLQNNPKANWSQVQLANESWSYSQQGLTPAGAALLSIAVAAYAPGLSASVAGSITATAGASAAAAASAGFAALQAQAAVAMVNNGGDIGKTLQQLGSEQSVKALLTTMATAGALNSLNTSMTLGDVKLKDITPANSSLGANLGKNIVNNLANATITSTLTGASLEEGIKTALTSAAISAGAGKTAGTIGDLTMNDQVTKALAHAIAGCVAGAAGSGGQGCNSGATGAVVGELAAQWYDNPPGSKSPADVLNFAKVMSAAAGAITGDGSAQSVNTAVITGVNAAQNNYLNHTERAQLSVLYRGCGSDESCKTKVVKEFVNKSTENDKALLVLCIQPASEACGAEMRESINYAADRDVDAYGMANDRVRSAGVNFAQAYSLPNGQGATYYNSRGLRNDFYTAAQDSATAKGSTVVWPQMAADVTRDAALGFHDKAVFNDSQTTKLSQNINRAIFSDAFNAFGSELLFSPPLTGAAADSFDRRMVGREQNAAQPFYNAYAGTPWLLNIGATYVPVNYTTCLLSGTPCAPTAPKDADITNLSDRLKFGNKLVDFYRNGEQR